MFENIEELYKYIELSLHRERRDLEYKRGEPWDTLKPQIIKTALAMANLEGGGHIIIGVEEGKNSMPFLANGIKKSDSVTYTLDNVSAAISEFADPHVEIDLKHYDDGNKYFIVIQIFEFNDVPVICKKDGNEMYGGRIYWRSTRKVESTSNISAEGVRTILDRAIDKGIIKQSKRIEKYNGKSDSVLFKEERGNF